MVNEDQRAHTIILGNEKGGTGKSTIAMHLIVGLLRQGNAVGSLDLDANQATLTRYLLNRSEFAKSRNLRLPMPEHHAIKLSTLGDLEEAQADERNRLQDTLEHVASRHDYVVMDSQGSDTYLSRLAHSYADVVVTPLNDSFLDLDLLASVHGEPPEIDGPSRYSEMLWAMKKIRAQRDGGLIDWVVLRNRLTNLDARNKRAMADTVQSLSERIGFRIANGFSERVIFRELFLQGLTVLDLRDDGAKVPLKMSHLAARQEVRSLVAAVQREEEAREPASPPMPGPRLVTENPPRRAGEAGS